MPLAVPELIWLALLLFAFAVVYTLRKFIEGLFGPLISALGHVPGVGGLLSGVLRAIEQSVSNALGSAEGRIDSAIGASFHQLARLTDWLWREFKAHSLIGMLLATLVANLALAYHRLEHGVRDLTHGAQSIGKRLGHFERELHGIEHGVRDLARYVHRVIGQDVLPEIRSLDRELTHIESKVIPDIRSIAQGAEHDMTALRKWIADNALIAGTTALAGAVAWALSRLGVGWTRCSNWNKIGNRFCGLGADLIDALLLGTLAVAGGVSLVGLANEMVGLADTFVPVITRFFTEMSGVTRRTANEQGFV